jgi:hypothetical protein
VVEIAVKANSKSNHGPKPTINIIKSGLGETFITFLGSINLMDVLLTVINWLPLFFTGNLEDGQKVYLLLYNQLKKYSVRGIFISPLDSHEDISVKFC